MVVGQQGSIGCDEEVPPVLHYGPALHVGVRGATDTLTPSCSSGPGQNWSTLTGCSRILLIVVAGVMLTLGSSSARCTLQTVLAPRPAVDI